MACWIAYLKTRPNHLFSNDPEPLPIPIASPGHPRDLLIDDDKVIAACDIRCNIVLLMNPPGFQNAISIHREGRDDATFDWSNGKISVSTADSGTIIVVGSDGVVSRAPAAPGLAEQVFKRLYPSAQPKPSDVKLALTGIVNAEILNRLK